jgi:hypothetical protein
VKSGLLLNVEQTLFRAAAVGGLAADGKVTVLSRGVCDPFAVGRPEGRDISNRPKGDSGAHSTRQIEHPDIGLTGIHLESDAISLRGKDRALQVRELVGNGADLPAAIHPD